MVKIPELKIVQFLEDCEYKSRKSKDPNTKVAAILVDPKSLADLSTGYNGTVRGAKERLIPATSPAKRPYYLHAEVNLLLNCCRLGIKTEGLYLFCSHSPCSDCARHIYQAGIEVVFFKHFYHRWDEMYPMLDLKHNLIKTPTYNLMVLSQ